MSEVPPKIYIPQKTAKSHWLQLKIEGDTEYRRSDTVVSKDIADELAEALKEINKGFQQEYGHSDADRYNRDIRHWNGIVRAALAKYKEVKQ